MRFQRACKESDTYERGVVRAPGNTEDGAEEDDIVSVVTLDNRSSIEDLGVHS